MYFSAFQSNAFQSNAFQIKRGGAEVVPISGGKGADLTNYHQSRYDWERHKYLEKQRLLNERQEENDREIRIMEARRRDRLDDLALQTRLFGLLKESEELRLENIRLDQLINFRLNDEDDIMILLACDPFYC